MYYDYDHVLGIILYVCPEHCYGVVPKGRPLVSHMLQSNCAVSNPCGTVCVVGMWMVPLPAPIGTPSKKRPTPLKSAGPSWPPCTEHVEPQSPSC